jgi:[ribosomal protein S18]-alanine N-acetyltransferase
LKVPPQALRTMTADDLDRVVDIESRSYSHPWTRGNFMDSLHNGYQTRVGVDAFGAVVAYSVVMLGVDEDHLLNVTVDPANQRSGWGGFLLRDVIEGARARRAGAVWLEVRASNHAALQLYERFGFETSGRRRDYYPAAKGREDAVLMSLPLAPTVREPC